MLRLPRYLKRSTVLWRNISSNNTSTSFKFAPLTLDMIKSDSEIPGSLFSLAKNPDYISKLSYQPADLLIKLGDSNIASLSDYELGQIMYSLKIMVPKRTNGQAQNYEGMLSTLQRLIFKAPLKWSNKTIRMAVYGIQNMSGNVKAEKLVLLEISKQIQQCKQLFGSTREIASTLYGLKGLSTDYEEVRKLIGSLVLHLPDKYVIQSPASQAIHNTNSSNCGMSGLIQARDISNIVFGMQKLSSAYHEVRLLVIKIVPMIHAYTTHYLHPSTSPISTDKQPMMTVLPPSAQEVDNVLFGLKSLSSQTYEVQLLIKSLIPYVASCVDHPQYRGLSVNNISAMLHGLQNFYCKHEAVRNLVGTINQLLYKQSSHYTPPAPSNTSPTSPPTAPTTPVISMNGMNIGNALFGLRNMSTNYKEIRELMYLLEVYMKPIPAPSRRADRDQHVYTFYSAHNISNAVYGLRRMSSTHEETRRIVAALADRIEQDNAHRGYKHILIMSAQEVSNTIYGLQSLNSEHFEVKRLIRAVTPLISRCKETMTGTGIANMLYGMKLLSVNEIEVSVLWNIITHYLQSCANTVPSRAAAAGVGSTPHSHPASIYQMKVKEVSMAMYGLSNSSSDYPEIRDVIQLLPAFIPPGPYPSLTGSSPYQNATFVSCMIYGLKNMSTTHEEVLMLLTTLNPLLKHYQDHVILNKHHVFMCIVGIQHLTPSYAECRTLYTIITAYIHRYQNNVYAWSMKNQIALQAIQQLERKYTVAEYPELQGLVTAFYQAMQHTGTPAMTQELMEDLSDGLDTAVPEVEVK